MKRTLLDLKITLTFALERDAIVESTYGDAAVSLKYCFRRTRGDFPRTAWIQYE